MESCYMKCSFLYYVPNVVDDNGVLIGALFHCAEIENGSEIQNGICTLMLDSNWENQVRVLDPDADLEVLTALFREIRGRLSSEPQRSEMILQLEDSFSNLIQLSQRGNLSLASDSAANAAFARGLFERTSTKVA